MNRLGKRFLEKEYTSVAPLSLPSLHSRSIPSMGHEGSFWFLQKASFLWAVILLSKMKRAMGYGSLFKFLTIGLLLVDKVSRRHFFELALCHWKARKRSQPWTYRLVSSGVPFKHMHQLDDDFGPFDVGCRPSPMLGCMNRPKWTFFVRSSPVGHFFAAHSYLWYLWVANRHNSGPKALFLITQKWGEHNSTRFFFFSLLHTRGGFLVFPLLSAFFILVWKDSFLRHKWKLLMVILFWFLRAQFGSAKFPTSRKIK